MKIPPILHQIWIGPNPRPDPWLQTWRDQHPNWTYRLWSNRDLHEETWINRKHISSYMIRRRYNGVADLMRYEILSRHGGVVVAADSVCLHPLDELFEDEHELYTIATDFSQYKEKPDVHNAGATTPLYAAAPGHWFTNELITTLHDQSFLRAPTWSTGNRYMQRMLRRHQPAIKIWPMHYFIPTHFNGWQYDGADRVYARHFWGTTRGTYPKR